MVRHGVAVVVMVMAVAVAARHLHPEALVPLLVLHVLLGDELLVPLDLGHDLLLVLRLERLRGRGWRR